MAERSVITVVRLKALRVIDHDDKTITEAADMRHAAGIEVEYVVRRDDAIFTPSLHLYASEGVQFLFSTDLEEDGLLRPRFCGSDRSVACIPGNFLNVGIQYDSIAMSHLDDPYSHLFERQAVAFSVSEGSENDTARGIFSGSLPGTIRPVLDWKNECISVDSVLATARV